MKKKKSRMIKDETYFFCIVLLVKIVFEINSSLATFPPQIRHGTEAEAEILAMSNKLPQSAQKLVLKSGALNTCTHVLFLLIVSVVGVGVGVVVVVVLVVGFGVVVPFVLGEEVVVVFLVVVEGVLSLEEEEEEDDDDLEEEVALDEEEEEEGVDVLAFLTGVGSAFLSSVLTILILLAETREQTNNRRRRIKYALPLHLPTRTTPNAMRTKFHASMRQSFLRSLRCAPCVAMRKELFIQSSYYSFISLFPTCTCHITTWN